MLKVKLTSSVALADSASMCLQADCQHPFLPSRLIVNKVINTIILMCRVHHEDKERLKPALSRRSLPEVFLRKGVLKTCIKFTGEHQCRSVISMKLQSNFIEIALRHGCSPVNLLHIFRTAFLKNNSGWLLLII